MRSFWHSKTYRKMLCSYLLVFVLPFSVLSLFTYSNLINVEQQRYATSKQQMALNLAQHIGLYYENAATIARLIPFDDFYYDIVKQSGTLSYKNAHDLQDRLRIYTTLADNYRNIWFYSKNQNYLFSSTDSCQSDNFFNARFQTSPETDFRKELLSGEYLRVFDTYDKKNYLFFSLPVQLSVSEDTIYFIFQIDFTTIEHSVKLLGDSSIISFSLLDNSANALTQIGSPSFTPYSLPKEEIILLTATEDISLYSYSGLKDTLFYQIQYNVIPWAFYLSLKIDPIGNTLFLPMSLLLLFLFLGYFIILAITRSNYAPIIDIKQHLSIQNDKTSKNDYELISAYIQKIHHQHNELQQSFQAHAHDTLRLMIRNLLSGHFSSPEEFNNLSDNIQLPNKHFVIFAYTASNLHSEAVIISEQTNILRVVFPLDTFELGLIFLDTSFAEETTSTLISYIQKTFADSSISLSEPCSDYFSIPCALSQALAIYDFSASPGSVLWYHDSAIQSVVNIQTYTQELLQASTLTVDQLHDLKLLLCHILVANGTHLSLQQNVDFFLRSDVSLDNIWLQSVRDILNLNSATDEQLPIMLIKNYIAEHCFDPTFSVKAMAAFFNMSSASLSHFFHLETGTLLNDYISDLRMNEACRLLVETDQSISGIGSIIGYTNPYSFTRRFQQLFNMTPSAYRQLHKTDDVSK